MDYHQAFAISSRGMSLERLRVDVAALNLANAHTVASPDGAVYRPMRVVARTSFAQALDTAGGLHPAPLDVRVEPTLQAPLRVHEPGHPMADANGFVEYAGVDAAAEMITLMSAMRAYEANVAAMSTARAMSLKALDIGGNA